MERVSRADLKQAPYNPRAIDMHARKKLEANIRKVGLVEPLVVNRRTMHLVSGHQRLAALDAIEGSPDYALDVAMVDLTEKQEKAQNVFMNNPASQGLFEAASLESLLGDLDRDMLADTGFDRLDVEELLGAASPVLGMFDLDKQAPEVRDEAEEIARIAGIKERKKAQRDKPMTPERDAENLAVLAFPDRSAQVRFCEAVGADPNAKWIDGAMVMRALGYE